MRLRATGQMHISSVKADTIRPGEEFDINDGEGQRLIARGLAVKVNAKKAPAPNNKAAPAPRNKGIRGAMAKAAKALKGE